MKRRPWSLVILAWIHVLAPIGSIFINAKTSGWTLTQYLQLYFLPHNFPQNFPNILFPILAGISIYICKKWSFWLYLLSLSGLFINSFLNYLTRTDQNSLWLLIFVFSVNIIVVSYFLIPAVREIYFNPRLRWWETSPRYIFTAPALLRFINSESSSETESAVQGEVTNISSSGLYIQTTATPADQKNCNIEFSSEVGNIQVSGELIRHLGDTRPGYGFKFHHTPDSKKNIDKLIQSLNQKGLLIPSRAPGVEDTLWYWIENLIRHGRGLIPKHPSKK